MAALGRKGGLKGGPARARALAPARRAALARRAARARWSRPVLSKDTRVDLLSLVAHCGSSVSPVEPPRRLEAEVLRAVMQSRRDSALARMLPVFLWRNRDRLDLPKLASEAKRRGQGPALGFFLEATSKLAGSRLFDEALVILSGSARPARPCHFFQGTARRAFERTAAERATPAAARRWGLLMNLPWESFAAYFAKTSML